MSDLIYNSTKPLEEFEVVKKHRKPSDDPISIQNAIDALTEANLKRHMDSVEGGQENRSAIRIIMKLPSAERTGRWESDGHTIACSNCHTINLHGRAWEYCPYCGARMEGEEE